MLLVGIVSHSVPSWKLWALSHGGGLGVYRVVGLSGARIVVGLGVCKTP